jgi:hypothetical protein
MYFMEKEQSQNQEVPVEVDLLIDFSFHGIKIHVQRTTDADNVPHLNISFPPDTDPSIASFIIKMVDNFEGLGAKIDMQVKDQEIIKKEAQENRPNLRFDDLV